MRYILNIDTGGIMGKVVITVKDKQYIIDDETGDIKEVIIQDNRTSQSKT